MGWYVVFWLTQLLIAGKYKLPFCPKIFYGDYQFQYSMLQWIAGFSHILQYDETNLGNTFIYINVSISKLLPLSTFCS